MFNNKLDEKGNSFRRCIICWSDYCNVLERERETEDRYVKGSSGNTTQGLNINKCVQTLRKVQQHMNKYSQRLETYKH